MAEGRSRRTWVWVVAGLAIVLVAALAVFIGLGMVVVTRNMKVTTASDATAEQEFEQVRARFGGQRPLIEVEEEGDRLRSRDELDRRMASYRGPAPQAMEVLAYNPAEQKLVRMSLPFWLLRMGSRRTLRLDVPGMGRQESNVTVEEIERAGPGLFLDLARREARVLIWTE